MKSFIRFLLLLLFVNFYSCDKEEFVTPDSIENQNTFKVNKTTLDTYSEETEEESLENIMQWVSYLTAQALVRNESAESFFVNTLVNGSVENTITLESLLDNDNVFRDAFLEEFYYYHIGSVCRDITPSGGPRPTDGAGSGTIGFLYTHMLLNDYDFEFYLPNGYNQSLDNVKSSARVDRMLGDLQGYNHFDRCKVEEITINSNDRGNILILK
ncbi:hypothetical protein [Aquimarina sp. 2201CG14-23]|uniref:hypothetical protein n=1 Tax=Aquimarina mycalae TaxID=3040073 RepID=UPI002477D520|nr:hypothetical protein [Aquimarina sp. 2201CG14-23]MDH7445379.1 hypothetical protein [Aquimarina sp. 2201CG14-23]